MSADAPPHQVQTKLRVKQFQTHQKSPQTRIKVFGSREQIHKQMVQSFKTQKGGEKIKIESQQESNMNWNKIVLTVQPRLINPSSSDYGRLSQALTDSFELPVSTNCTVNDVKGLVEARIRQGLTVNEGADLIELRVGDRLALPSSAKLSSILHNLNGTISAMIHFCRRGKGGSNRASETAFDKAPMAKIITNTKFKMTKFPQTSSYGGRNRLLTHLMKDKSQIFAQPIVSLCETEDHSNVIVANEEPKQLSTVQHSVTEHNFEQKLEKPESSQQRLASKPNTSKPINLNQRVSRMLANKKDIFTSADQEYENEYTQVQSSNRSFRSITSRLFPKVSLSASTQAKILAKIPLQKPGRTLDGVNSANSGKSSLSRAPQICMSPIMVGTTASSLQTSTNFLPKRNQKIVSSIGRLQDFSQADPLKTFTEQSPNNRNSLVAAQLPSNTLQMMSNGTPQSMISRQHLSRRHLRKQASLGKLIEPGVKLQNQSELFKISNQQNQSSVIRMTEQSCISRDASRLTIQSIEKFLTTSPSKQMTLKNKLSHSNLVRQGSQSPSQSFFTQLTQDQGLRKASARQATALIAQHARMLHDPNRINLNDSDGDTVISGDGQNPASNCSQAVILLDQMGLYALTEVVMDEQTFSDLLHLFICPQLGNVGMSGDTSSTAAFGQRRILKKIIETLTVSKANLIVRSQIGKLLVQHVHDIPMFLQRATQQLLQRATKLADLEKLGFDWICTLLKSKARDLIEIGLRVLGHHLDPTQNSQWNQKRQDWIKTIQKEHLHVLETFCDLDESMRMPDSYRQLARQSMLNLYQQSSFVQETVKDMKIAIRISTEMLLKTSSRAALTKASPDASERQYSTLQNSLNGKCNSGIPPRAFLRKGPLKKNPRMLNSFMSLQQPKRELMMGRDQRGQSTPQWNLRKVQAPSYSQNPRQT